MQKVFLSHNPFTVETLIEIADRPIAADSALAKLVEGKRMQIWIEDFFDKLFQDFQESSLFFIEFQGLETDYHDLEQVIKQAEHKRGLPIPLEHKHVVSPAKRIEKLHKLYQNAVKGPLKSLGTEDFAIHFAKALAPEFEVNVVATMSSGKSTLINSMLGVDLLPSKNEACTATIFYIYDRDGCTQFRGKRWDANEKALGGEQVVDTQTLEDWNRDSDTSRIEIVGEIPAIRQQEYASLVLIDTPGLNNSRNEAHGVATRRMLTDHHMPLVLYVLNATQLGIEDDKRLLKIVRDIMQEGGLQTKDRFLFVVNKIDEFDPEKGESIAQALTNVHDYLEQNGIKNPAVMPVSALLAKLGRQAKKDFALLTPKESRVLKNLQDFFVEESEMHLLQYMQVSSSVRTKIEGKLAQALAENNRLELAILHSGIPVLEAVIEEYLEKYALPKRVTNARDVLQRYLYRAEQEAGSFIELKTCTETQLQDIRKQLTKIQTELSDAERGKQFKEKLRHKKFVPDAEIESQIKGVRKQYEKAKLDVQGQFESAQVLPSEAKRVMAYAIKEIARIRQDVIALLEDAIALAQSKELESLYKTYQDYIIKLFGSAEKLEKFSSMYRLQAAVLSLPETTLLAKGSYTKSEVVGSYEQKIGKWYNPFSWGKTTTVYKYEDREYIDLPTVWSEMEAVVANDFEQILKQAKTAMEKQAKQNCDEFIHFMEQQLQQQIRRLIDERQHALSQRDELDKRIHEAEIQQGWIDDFRSSLGKTLAFQER